MENPTEIVKLPQVQEVLDDIKKFETVKDWWMNKILPAKLGVFLIETLALFIILGIVWHIHNWMALAFGVAYLFSRTFAFFGDIRAIYVRTVLWVGLVEAIKNKS